MKYKDTNYEIYEDGRCYSYFSNKFLTPQMSNKYPTYNLTIDGKKKKTYVHRMVAETFLAHTEDKNIVNHKDGNTHNFHISNLEWVTPSENSKHACATGLTPKGNQLINRFCENLPNEEWRPVFNFSQYLVSNYGRIMNGYTKQLLKPALKSAGYYQVSLWKNGKGSTKDLHQIILQSFYPDESLEGYVINHKDGNKKNNRLNNLEKITYQENNLHAVYQIKTHKCAKPVYQLNSEKEIIKEFSSIAAATRDTGINNISRAIKTNRMAGKYYWKFKE